MRLSVLSAPAALTLVAAACGGDALTGPEAEAAYAMAASHYPIIPASTVVFIDGKRMVAGQRLDQLDPKAIDRIEILEGAAAAALAGDEGRNGVIWISTKDGSRAAPPGER